MFRQYSKAALAVCYLALIVTAFWVYPRWTKDRTEATISFDVSGYYMYLPAQFIYHDIKHCGFKDSILSKYYPTPDFQQAALQPSGNYVMKYAGGQALLMAPWFAAAHLYCKETKRYPADGFSYPYQLAIGLGMLLYGFLGLYFLRKVLLKYFADGTVAVALLALVTGSNYLNYAAIDQGMSHSPLFTIYTLIIWCSIKFWERPALKYALFSGALCGLATLIRPTEIISLIIPLLWGVSNQKQLTGRIAAYKKYLRCLLPAVLCFLVFPLLQVAYWKIVSGHWVVYSYGDQGFSWLPPHLRSYAFAYRSGWLLYSPMLLLSFAGIIPFILRKQNVWPVLLVFFLSLYIVSAWNIWWYGGRAMVQYYPVLVFPIAALVEFAVRRPVLKSLLAVLMVAFAYINIWWLWNAHRGEVQVAEVSKSYFWRTLGRWHTTDAVTKLLDNEDSYEGEVKPVANLLTLKSRPDTLNTGAGFQAIHLDAAHDTLKEYTFALPKGAAWLRAYADIQCLQKEWDTWRMPQVRIRFYKDDRVVKENSIYVDRFLTDGDRKTISVDARIPADPYDRITLSFKNKESRTAIIIDDITVISFNP